MMIVRSFNKATRRSAAAAAFVALLALSGVGFASVAVATGGWLPDRVQPDFGLSAAASIDMSMLPSGYL